MLWSVEDMMYQPGLQQYTIHVPERVTWIRGINMLLLSLAGWNMVQSITGR